MKKTEYINKVMCEIHASRKIKKRIKEDLDERITISMEEDPFYDLVTEMGTPSEFAQEFNDELYENGVLRKGSRYTTKPYEYKSKATLFGVPLIHINTSGSYGTRYAKGIIAIGDVAIGVFAFGGVAMGGLTVGGVSLGAVALGGVAIGGVALGGVALGLIGIGGVSIGLLKAFGALSI